MAVGIVQCTDQYRKEVLDWLREEWNDYGEGFWANHSVIEEYHLADMVVAIDDDGAPIAFAAVTEEGIDLFSVRDTHEGKGVGTKLAHFTIQLLWDRGLQAVTLLCSPKKSYGFWQKMGFDKVDPTADVNDFNILLRARLYRTERLDGPVNESGVTAAVQVQSLFPERRDGTLCLRVCRTTEIIGAQLNGCIYLRERIIVCKDHNHTVIKIIVDGKMVHQGRIKYLNDGQYGVKRVIINQRPTNQFFFDYVVIAGTAQVSS
jgi:GNAT superfamily N-acetyltransferase